MNEGGMEPSKSQDYRILAAVLSIPFGHKFRAGGLPDHTVVYWPSDTRGEYCYLIDGEAVPLSVHLYFRMRGLRLSQVFLVSVIDMTILMSEEQRDRSSRESASRRCECSSDRMSA